jgi:alpha-N-arabinofuranosidase
MFEDINHSGDGGIYAELLTNRAFQGNSSIFSIIQIPLIPGSGSDVKLGETPNLDGNVIVESENTRSPSGPVLTGWRTIGKAKMSLDKLHPLSEALPTVMQLDIAKDAKGEVGIVNHGETYLSQLHCRY